MENHKNNQARIGEEFSKELRDIQEKRIELGVDKKRSSIRRLTNLIVKHHVWNKIKEDMLKYKFKEK